MHFTRDLEWFDTFLRGGARDLAFRLVHGAMATEAHVTALTSRFNNVPQEPPDPIFGLSALYVVDPAPVKVNLVIGAYRTEEGNPWVLPVVKKVGGFLKCFFRF